MEESTAPLRRIHHVQFGILSPEEIINMAVCEITSAESMENGQPKQGGLMDPRMGSTSRFYKCTTCLSDDTICPGHFGSLTLAKPVFHASMLILVRKVLQCVCYSCSKLLCPLTDEEQSRLAKMKLKNRFAFIYDKCRTIYECRDDLEDVEHKGKHMGCGRRQPKYKKPKDDNLALELEWSDKDEQNALERTQALLPERVHGIFKNISDAESLLMGFDPKFGRPDWMIIKVLPVPPLAVRPAIQMEASVSQDDLTHKLSDIIKTNNKLAFQEKNGAAAHQMLDDLKLLQYHVATYVDNEMPGVLKAHQKKSGRPLKSIRQRLKGKEGRVRGNLMGKRVDFSARTVITADPNLSLDEVGVPLSIARNLTFPEIVTPFNIEYLTGLVRRGAAEHPGANYVDREDGQRYDLKRAQLSDIHLAPGYIVHRHLQNGDPIIFNRQPSLHKMSMMGHRVRVLPWSTFRLNLSVTAPYNADFDGDEMNMHVPQSVESKAEITQIMMVPRQILTPKSNGPVMGIVQDALSASTKFTNRDKFLDKALTMTLLMWLPDWDGRVPQPAILKPQPLWTGKQIFSMMLPPNINLIRFHSTHNREENSHPVNRHLTPGDTKVLIEDSILLTGTTCKSTLGAGHGSLIHVMYRDCGMEKTVSFINAMQRVLNNWLMREGHSIGVKDCTADKNTDLLIQATIEACKVEVKNVIHAARTGQMQQKAGHTLVETFENKINEQLNKAREDAGANANKSLSKFNNFKLMADAGSKGSTTNIAQVIACVGQQNVEGKRIPFGFRSRSLPHFVKDDFGPESKGFVENSYRKGLTPSEMFFHAMGGREGLIDTAVKTSSTGYIQRRLVKAMEDVMVKYDGTVRNSVNQIVQFLYGEDGLDGAQVELVEHPTIKTNLRQLEKDYYFNMQDRKLAPLLKAALQSEVLDNLEEGDNKILEEEWAAIKADKLLSQKLFPTGTGLLGKNWPTVPVNVDRLLWSARKQFRITGKDPTDLNPKTVVADVRELLKRLRVIDGDDPLSIESQTNSTLILGMYLRAKLASFKIVLHERLNVKAFNWVLGEIESKFNMARIQPSEMVGAVAAQSLGEPATQMTLNTFHFAGVSSKNVTLGVPRLTELINVSANPKTPSLTVYLESDVANDQDAAKVVVNRLQYTTLRHVTAGVEIWYDPDPRKTIIKEDAEFVSDFFDVMPESEDEKLRSRWLLRIEISKSARVDKDVTMDLLSQRITALMNVDSEVIECINSDDNSRGALVLRIRFLFTKEEEQGVTCAEMLTAMKQFVEYIMDQVVLSGVSGVKRVYMNKVAQVSFDENGNFSANDSQKEWMLETDGSNLQKALSTPNVDVRRTTCNDVTEINKILGIEAARQALLKEVYNVYDKYGIYINYRHLAVLCDVMTARSNIMAITRHGINRQETGPLMRASFEETVEILVEAACFSEKDDLFGVSENVILGQLAPLGTGNFDLFMDEVMLRDAIDMPVMGAGAEYGTFLYGTNMNMTPLQANTQTPYDERSPGYQAQWSPAGVAAFSPDGSGRSPGGWGGSNASSPSTEYDSRSPGTAASPGYSTSPSPGYMSSPAYQPTSPATYSPTSPSWSPSSPAASPHSPSYSPVGSAASPHLSPTSPGFSPSSPSYSPSSPAYSPTSPAYQAGGASSPAYSPVSPGYSPTSPRYSPTSPAYSPTSPAYSPTSPAAGNRISPTSPAYSPTSPRQYSPTSPGLNQSYSPTSPNASSSTPNYSPPDNTQ